MSSNWTWSSKTRRVSKILPKVLERVKEGISIKHNDKFDLEQYLKQVRTFLKRSKKIKKTKKPNQNLKKPANPK